MFYDTQTRPPGGRGGRGGDQVGRGRKLSSEELQLLLLGLLEQAPAHGYELMQRLEQHSGGYYSPSPGMVYPALAYLDDAGQITAEAKGNRKSYRLTPAGEVRLALAREVVEGLMAGLARIGARMEEIRDAFSGLHDLDPVAANELHDARRRLKQALYQKRGCSPEEARRIADILNRTTEDLLRTTQP